MTMKKFSSLVVAAVVLLALYSIARACASPDVGEQYKLNGHAFEIVKVKDADCNIKVCVRPVGSKQACRWVNDPRLDPNYDGVK